MSVLILNFIIISIILVIASNHKKKASTINKIKETGINKKMVSVIDLLLPFIFIQLLYLKSFVDINTVPDLDGYKDYFGEAGYLSIGEIFRTKAEFGFYLLAKLCYSISHDYRFFLLVFNAIMLSLFLVWIRKRSTNIALSVIFFLLLAYNGSVFVLRQYMAIAILLMSHKYIIERKFLFFLLLVLVAMTFHRTAIIFFPLYFVYNIRSKFAAITAFVSFAAIAFWALQNPLLIISELSNNENYVKYLNGEQYSSTIMVALVCLSYLIAYIFIIRKRILRVSVARLYFCMLAIATMISFFGAGLPLLGRLVKYYDIALVLIIPYIVKYIKTRPVRYVFVAVVFLLEFYIAFLSSSAEGYINMKVPTIFDLVLG